MTTVTQQLQLRDRHGVIAPGGQAEDRTAGTRGKNDRAVRTPGAAPASRSRSQCFYKSADSVDPFELALRKEADGPAVR